MSNEEEYKPDKETFTLTRDNDGHWFIIEVDDLPEFEKILESDSPEDVEEIAERCNPSTIFFRAYWVVE